MAINYSGYRDAYGNRGDHMGEALRVLQDARPEDIVSFETVMSPHSFDREVRVILRVPYERQEEREMYARRMLDRMEAMTPPIRAINIDRISPDIFETRWGAGRIASEVDDEDEEEENRLRRLGVR